MKRPIPPPPRFVRQGVEPRSVLLFFLIALPLALLLAAATAVFMEHANG